VMFGLGCWGMAEAIAADATVPPALVGLAASILGMVMGSFIPRAQASQN